MQPVNGTQNEHDILRDKVYAAMETGNAGRARTLVEEYADLYPEQAQALRSEVLVGYGTAL
jgi:outer membrane protein assembly factor BamD (BamD/ComL family)